MKNKRRYLSVADKITQLINDGVYPPGSRLPGERELAEQLGVSRVTIREAEIALQAQGYLAIKTGSGVYVLEPTERVGQQLPNVSAFELTEARLLFESEAAALAARAIDDRTLDQLAALVEKMSDDDPQRAEATQQADREFHLTIAAASGNAAVQYIIETLWKLRTELTDVVTVHEAVCSEETASDRYTEHAEVLEGLRNHDSTAARTAMQRHFRRLLQSMIDVTEERALEELRKKASESRERYLDSAAPDQPA
ncbi:MAG: FadR/GntR family transcriptional regulator [Congregibacter sp.]